MTDPYEDPEDEHGKLWSQFAQPYSTDLDNDSLTLCWRYGSQGHPASFMILLQYDRECNYEPYLTIHTNSHRLIERGIDNKYQFDPKLIKKFIKIGEDVNKRFGHEDPYWWRCKEGCHGMVYTSGPYTRCPECEDKRHKAEQATIEYYKNLEL